MLDQWEETTADYGIQYLTVPPLRLLYDYAWFVSFTGAFVSYAFLTLLFGPRDANG